MSLFKSALEFVEFFPRIPLRADEFAGDAVALLRQQKFHQPQNLSSLRGIVARLFGGAIQILSCPASRCAARQNLLGHAGENRAGGDGIDVERLVSRHSAARVSTSRTTPVLAAP